MLPRVLALIVALGVGIGVTGPKLYKMAQIKGWLPGATAADWTVTQKWHQTPNQHPSGRNTYWIATTEEDIRKIGPHRLNVPSEKWESLKEGDKLEIVSVPGDPAPYLRDGIFVSWGNFAFDLALLGVEFGVVGVMVWPLRRLRKRSGGTP